MSGVGREGFLKKQSGALKQWKKLYFRINFSNGLLEYGNTKAGPFEGIPLYGVKTIEPFNEKKLPANTTKKQIGLGITIESGDKKYYLMTEVEKECQEWMVDLQKAAQQISNMSFKNSASNNSLNDDDEPATAIMETPPTSERSITPPLEDDEDREDDFIATPVSTNPIQTPTPTPTPVVSNSQNNVNAQPKQESSRPSIEVEQPVRVLPIKDISGQLSKISHTFSYCLEAICTFLYQENFSSVLDSLIEKVVPYKSVLEKKSVSELPSFIGLHNRYSLNIDCSKKQSISVSEIPKFFSQAQIEVSEKNLIVIYLEIKDYCTMILLSKTNMYYLQPQGYNKATTCKEFSNLQLLCTTLTQEISGFKLKSVEVYTMRRKKSNFEEILLGNEKTAEKPEKVEKPDKTEKLDKSKQAIIEETLSRVSSMIPTMINDKTSILDKRVSQNESSIQSIGEGISMLPQQFESKLTLVTEKIDKLRNEVPDLIFNTSDIPDTFKDKVFSKIPQIISEKFDSILNELGAFHEHVHEVNGFKSEVSNSIADLHEKIDQFKLSREEEKSNVVLRDLEMKKEILEVKREAERQIAEYDSVVSSKISDFDTKVANLNSSIEKVFKDVVENEKANHQTFEKLNFTITGLQERIVDLESRVQQRVDNFSTTLEKQSKQVEDFFSQGKMLEEESRTHDKFLEQKLQETSDSLSKYFTEQFERFKEAMNIKFSDVKDKENQISAKERFLKIKEDSLEQRKKEWLEKSSKDKQDISDRFKVSPLMQASDFGLPNDAKSLLSDRSSNSGMYGLTSPNTTPKKPLTIKNEYQSLLDFKSSPSFPTDLKTKTVFLTTSSPLLFEAPTIPPSPLRKFAQDYVSKLKTSDATFI